MAPHHLFELCQALVGSKHSQVGAVDDGFAGRQVEKKVFHDVGGSHDDHFCPASATKVVQERRDVPGCTRALLGRDPRGNHTFFREGTFTSTVHAHLRPVQHQTAMKCQIGVGYTARPQGGVLRVECFARWHVLQHTLTQDDCR